MRKRFIYFVALGLGLAATPALTTQAAAQGPWHAASGYAKVTSTVTAWHNFNWQGGRKLTAGTGLVVRGVYHHQNGSTYYSVANLDRKWVGYVNASKLQTLTSPWSTKQAASGIVTVTRNWPAYRNFSWAKTGSLYHHTYKVSGQYRHLNGQRYYTLIDAAGKFKGLINAAAVTRAKNANGVAWRTGSYGVAKVAATSGFGGQVRTSAKALALRPAKITWQYRTLAGTVWDSLYDANGHWLGYAPAKSVTTTAAQGRFTKATGYVTTTKQGQRLWSSFGFKGGVSTTKAYQNTYRIRGVYHHFNGQTYASVATGSNHWVGYVNLRLVSQTSGAQGSWLSYRHDLVATKRYPIWRGWFGKEKGRLTVGKTYHVTGRYHHVNGSWYVSLYTGKTWLGYVNAKALGPAVHNYLKPSQSYAYPNAKAASFNIEVDLSSQQVYLKYGSKRVYTMYCSSGMNNSTPRGHFKIQAERGYSFYNANEKMGAHYWTSFLDHGVYLFHSVPTDAHGHYIKAETTQLGVKPRSHGCIRLSVPDAKWINGHVRTGTKVYIHQ